jgi:hypothetical protein
MPTSTAPARPAHGPDRLVDDGRDTGALQQHVGFEAGVREAGGAYVHGRVGAQLPGQVRRWGAMPVTTTSTAPTTRAVWAAAGPMGPAP